MRIGHCTFTSAHLSALTGATHVRIVIVGALTRKTTFDHVGLSDG